MPAASVPAAATAAKTAATAAASAAKASTVKSAAAAAATAAAAIKTASTTVTHAPLLTIILTSLAVLLAFTIIADIYLRITESQLRAVDPEKYQQDIRGEPIVIEEGELEIHPLVQLIHAIKFFTGLYIIYRILLYIYSHSASFPIPTTLLSAMLTCIAALLLFIIIADIWIRIYDIHSTQGEAVTDNDSEIRSKPIHPVVYLLLVVLALPYLFYQNISTTTTATKYFIIPSTSSPLLHHILLAITTLIIFIIISDIYLRIREYTIPKTVYDGVAIDQQTYKNKTSIAILSSPLVWIVLCLLVIPYVIRYLPEYNTATTTTTTTTTTPLASASATSATPGSAPGITTTTTTTTHAQPPTSTLLHSMLITLAGLILFVIISDIYLRYREPYLKIEEEAVNGEDTEEEEEEEESEQGRTSYPDIPPQLDVDDKLRYSHPSIPSTTPSQVLSEMVAVPLSSELTIHTEILRIHPQYHTRGSTIVLFMIPGNPGLAHYYHTFIQSLYRQCNESVEIHVIGHGLHTCQDMNGMLQSPLSLDQQVQHKYSYISMVMEQHRVEGADVKYMLAGHSMGAHICIRLLAAQLIPSSQLLHAFLLFPTLLHIAHTPNGERFYFLIYYLRMCIATTASLLGMLPGFIQRTLIRTFFLAKNSDKQHTPYHVEGATPHDDVDEYEHLVRTTQHMLSWRNVSNMLYLAKTEFEGIRDLDEQVVMDYENRMTLYYGPDDAWAPLPHFEAMLSWFPGLHVELSDGTIPHAFMLGSSHRMAAIMSTWINDLLTQGVTYITGTDRIGTPAKFAAKKGKGKGQTKGQPQVYVSQSPGPTRSPVKFGPGSPLRVSGFHF